MLRTRDVFRALTRLHRNMTTLLGFARGLGSVGRRSPTRWLTSCSLASPIRNEAKEARQRVALFQHSADGSQSRALTVSSEQTCQQTAEAAHRDTANSALVTALPAPSAGRIRMHVSLAWTHVQQLHTTISSLTACLCRR